MARQLAYSASSLLLAKDDAKLQAMLNKAKDDKDVLSLVVLDTDNKVVAASDNDQVGKPFFDAFVPIGRYKCNGVHQDKLRSRFVFMRQSSFSKTPVGCVMVQISSDALQRATRGALAQVLLITGIIALAVILISFLTLRRTLRPLSLVIEGTRLGHDRLDDEEADIGRLPGCVRRVVRPCAAEL